MHQLHVALERGKDESNYRWAFIYLQITLPKLGIIIIIHLVFIVVATAFLQDLNKIDQDIIYIICHNCIF